ncbi:PspC domain-containing protein [Aurantiacibacter rhizosphaerae]|uniref:PspC domain-containing protein n=1 Tax=Aurantiacibacter rhizosphaerae TaxID=2691582 RepID=A0A844XAP6_9SPHN|nr:PspC domain-containing protein [Aurantiacibacter rhizosphaerae]MWV27467.1 PspC domain-containing protein [Aurantiacibacter rhizosphaerae]
MSDLERNNNAVRPSGQKKFRLDHANGKIAGVCGGIAKYIGMDPLIVRIIFAVGAVAGFGSFILIYLAIWLLAD